MRIVNLVFLALFVLSVVVQYNDPDPLRWMLMYGGAAAACIIAMYRPVPRLLTSTVAVLAVVWIALLMPRVLGQVSLGEMFREAGMATMAIEEGREAIGLLLVALWMGVLCWRPAIARRSPAPAKAEL